MQHRFEVEVNGKPYTIQHFSPTKSLSVLTRLMKYTGTGLVGSSAKLDTDAVAAVIAGIGDVLSKLDEKEVLALVKDMLSCVYKGTATQPVNFEADFMGVPDEVLELCGQVVKVQYAGFLDRLAAKFKPLLTKAIAQMGIGQTGSTGSSGDQSSPESQP